MESKQPQPIKLFVQTAQTVLMSYRSDHPFMKRRSAGGRYHCCLKKFFINERKSQGRRVLADVSLGNQNHKVQLRVDFGNPDQIRCFARLRHLGCRIYLDFALQLQFTSMCKSDDLILPEQRVTQSSIVTEDVFGEKRLK